MGNKEKLEKMKTERLGETNISKEQYIMKIVEYKNARDIIVEFQDEYNARIHTEYKNFKKGEVKNPYDKNVFGVGYYGQGKYKSKGKDGKHTKAYITWVSMLRRCYDPYYINKHLTYIDCYVCKEWHNFQNFAEWYYKNYYELEGDKIDLDKDILYKGNKIYSPETCILVPQRINILFTKRDATRGEYPIGVTYYKKNNNLKVHCNLNGKQKHLGYFPLNRPFQAFYTYKMFKENYIKQVADEYKDLIPQKLYNALYKYRVEIND